MTARVISEEMQALAESVDCVLFPAGPGMLELLEIEPDDPGRASAISRLAAEKHGEVCHTECRHEDRTRYEHGFLCNDCYAFFDRSSPLYRKTELVEEIWNVLNNINVERHRSGLPEDPEVAAMKARIGIMGVDRHDDYEDIIVKAKPLMERYGKTEYSAIISLK